MARGKQTLVQRIALDGDDEIRKGLQALGKDGQAAFKALKRAADDSAKAGVGLNANLVTLRKRLDDVGKAAGKIRERFRFLGTETSRLAGLLAGAFSIREIARVSDQYVELQNILRVVGGEQTNVNETISQLADVANRTRSPLEAIATLYQRASIAGKELQASQSDILRFTENVGLALAQQGGSAEQARGALLQLSQALGAGVVRAEEFNSILEGAFPIAQAAANGIERVGGSVAQLRAEILAGNVTSREFFEAILSQSDELEAAFGKTVPTISQALSVLNNNFVLLVGTANEASGVTSVISRLLLFLADNLQTVAAVALTVGAAFAVVKGVGLAVEIFSLLRALTALIPVLVSIGATLLANPITLWALAIAAAATAVLALTGQLDDFVGAVQETTGPIFDAVGAFLGLSKESATTLDGISTDAPRAASALGGITGASDTAAASLQGMGGQGESAFERISNGVQQVQNNMQGLLTTMRQSTAQAQRLYQELEAVGGSSGSFQTVSDTSANSIQTLAGGGRVVGPGTATSDSILARLSNGEFVVRAAAVRKYGTAFLRALNSGRLPKFAFGGLVDNLTAGFSIPSPVPAFAEGGEVSPSGRPLTLNIGGETFAGLIAPEDVADRLAKYATGRKVRRAGSTPSWFGGSK